MKRALRKDLLKELIKTRRRFISIVLIVMLGVGFYAGIKITTPTMQHTSDKYFDNQNFMDFKLMSVYGITKENVDKIKNNSKIEAIMPSYSKDIIGKKNNDEFVVNVNSLPNGHNEKDKSYINRLIILEGRLPKNEDEIVLDKVLANKQSYSVGDKIILDDSDFLKNKEYKVVGIVESPLYISIERGNTSIGSGSVTGFAYVLESNIKSEIYTEVYVTVKDAKKEICYLDAYEDIIRPVEKKLEKLSNELGKEKYDEIVNKASKEVNEGKTKLTEAKAERDIKISEGSQSIANARTKIESGEKEILDNEQKANTEFTKAENKLAQAEKELSGKENEFKTQKENGLKEIEIAKVKLKELEENKVKLETSKTEITAGMEKINASVKAIEGLDGLYSNLELLKASLLDSEKTDEEKATIQTQIDTITYNISEIYKAFGVSSELTEEEKTALMQTQKTSLLTKKKELEENLKKIDVSYPQVLEGIKTVEAGIKDGEKKIADGETALKDARGTLNNQKSKLIISKRNTYSQIATAKANLEDAKAKLSQAEQTLKTETEKAAIQIDEAKKKIIDAEEQISKIKKPKWYVLDRKENAGYEEYRQNALKIDALSKIFPVVFFVVAALVCLTSMSRMVEEERQQIGTMKALGYKKKQIASKYIIYALLATIIGSIIGIFVGISIIPKIIVNSYGIMYSSMPKMEIPKEYQIPLSASLLAIILTVFATIRACNKELVSTPAALMRPKAPLPGKRILLEKIPFIWDCLNFTQKVTARNIFRYKKKFFMTIIGISGCTALIVTGFGIKDSVAALVPKQFDDIYKFDVQAGISDKVTTKGLETINKAIKDEKKIKSYSKMKILSTNMYTKEDKHETYVAITEDKNQLSKLIKFYNKKEKTKLTLKDDEVLITEKLASMMNVKKGDKIKIEFDDEKYEVIVGGITDNYVWHYIYMSKEYYEKIVEKDIKYNMLYIDTEKMTKADENQLAKNMLKNENITSFSYISNSRSVLDKTFKALNKVIWILIVSASILAFVVLYNLSNINISERTRELATIKVLGFYDEEVSKYVYRETILLTEIGVILGLIAGYFLEAFTIRTCEVDMVRFEADISVASYVYGALITILCTYIVNVVTHLTLKKIDMIESLKSVE